MVFTISDVPFEDLGECLGEWCLDCGMFGLILFVVCISALEVGDVWNVVLKLSD